MQGLRLYPANNPQIQKQLNNSIVSLTRLISSQDKLTIDLIDGTLMFNDIPCLDQLPVLQKLARLLKRQQLQSVEMLHGSILVNC